MNILSFMIVPFVCGYTSLKVIKQHQLYFSVTH